MSGGLLGANLLSLAAVKRKVFVSYNHDEDQAYYNTFSNAFQNTYEVITDNSLARAVDSDNAEYVMRRIRENHIKGSSCTIVLVGEYAHARKYVDWEIKATLDMQHGLIGVMLPTLPINNMGRVNVPPRLSDNIDSGYALWVSWANMTASAPACQGYIEAANARKKDLIENSRALRLRNG